MVYSQWRSTWILFWVCLPILGKYLDHYWKLNSKVQIQRMKAFMMINAPQVSCSVTIMAKSVLFKGILMLTKKKRLGYPERCHNNCFNFDCFRLHYFLLTLSFIWKNIKVVFHLHKIEFVFRLKKKILCHLQFEKN